MTDKENFRKIDMAKVKEYLQQFDKTTSKIYLGCDSERFKIDGV